MQFSFLGFSVKKVMEFELDVKDLAILRFFQDFMKSGKMNYEEVDGVKYYWISYKNISEEMPFLGLGKRTVMMRMLRLRDLGLLSHYTKKEGGTFSYYTLGDKFNDLLYTSENRLLSKIEDESKNIRREISGQGTRNMNSIDEQFNSIINSNTRGEISGEATSNMNSIDGQSYSGTNSNISGDMIGQASSNINSASVQTSSKINSNNKEDTIGQADGEANLNNIAGMVGEEASKINSISEQTSIKINQNKKKNIGSFNINSTRSNREERLDYVKHSNEGAEESIQVNFEELIKNREDTTDRYDRKNKVEMNYGKATLNKEAKGEMTIVENENLITGEVARKEEDTSISEDPIQNNNNTLSKDMNRGCSVNDTTKTNLLNNLTTINTNDLKSIKDKLEFILNYLNIRANVNYRISNRKTFGLITARLREGFTAEDFKVVIDKKVSEWSGTNFEQYLNPFTLFGDKFELYLNQKVASKKNNGNGGVGNSKSGKFYKQDTRKLRFHNFTGREVDYDAIEKQLLGWE